MRKYPFTDFIETLTENLEERRACDYLDCNRKHLWGKNLNTRPSSVTTPKGRVSKEFAIQNTGGTGNDLILPGWEARLLMDHLTNEELN